MTRKQNDAAIAIEREHSEKQINAPNGAARPNRGGVGAQRMGMPLAGDMRSPLAKARDQWLESADGEKCADPLTLKTSADQRQYLENRLVQAFLAGADWMARQQQKGKGHTDEALRRGEGA